MSKSKIFVGICISFACGIFLKSLVDLSIFYIYGVLAFSALLFAFTFKNKNREFMLLGLFLFSAGLGALRLQSVLKLNEFAGVLQQKVSMEGYITEEADIRDSYQFLTFHPKGYSQNILISAKKDTAYSYGDYVVVEGKVVEPENFDDFDYQKYLERFNVYAQVKYPKILVLKTNQLSKTKFYLLRVKAVFVKRVNSLFKEPQGGLLLGILIGAKRSLPQNVLDNFSRTGTSHIIAISGFNITIIIASLAFLARFLGRKVSLTVSLLIIAGFVVLTGASASVVRAAVMGSMLLLSRNIGRQYSVAPSLFFAGFVMLAINPKILYWDVGFELSFLATLGIVYFLPLFEELTESWPKLWELKSIFLVTMAATLVTLPLILLKFGRLSLVAPLANIAILPLVPATMLLGFLSVLPFFGPGFAFVANFLLVYVLKTTAVLARPGFSSLDAKISGWFFGVLLAAIFLFYYLLKKKAGKKVQVETTPAL